jgi:hypothetical protein
MVKGQHTTNFRWRNIDEEAGEDQKIVERINIKSELRKTWRCNFIYITLCDMSFCFAFLVDVWLSLRWSWTFGFWNAIKLKDQKVITAFEQQDLQTRAHITSIHEFRASFWQYEYNDELYIQFLAAP